MTITDQQLADAIREKFPFEPKMVDDYDFQEFGRAIHRFCDQHPAWRPTPGGRAYWTSQEYDVWTVGPNPNDDNEWVVMLDNEATMIACRPNLEPPGAKA